MHQFNLQISKNRYLQHFSEHQWFW